MGYEPKVLKEDNNGWIEGRNIPVEFIIHITHPFLFTLTGGEHSSTLVGIFPTRFWRPVVKRALSCEAACNTCICHFDSDIYLFVYSWHGYMTNTRRIVEEN